MGTTTAGRFVTIAGVGDVPPGRLKVFKAEAHRVAVCQVDGRFYAVEDVCTHDAGPLGEGELHGEEVECPRHGARFNVKTGAAVTMPAVVPVKVYETRVEDGRLQVRLEA